MHRPYLNRIYYSSLVPPTNVSIATMLTSNTLLQNIDEVKKHVVTSPRRMQAVDEKLISRGLKYSGVIACKPGVH